MPAPRIRIGIGGWVFAPWRGLFYPKGLPQKRELAHAAGRLGMIEINATYHSLHTRADFARWAGETPDDFCFSVKASRYCTNRRELSGAREAVGRFLDQGLDALGERLGPILWQFMPTKKFDPEDFAGFLNLLPDSLGGRPLRHALEVRNPTFNDPRFIDLVRAKRASVVIGASLTHPLFYDGAADFAYLRLQTLKAEESEGMAPSELDLWGSRLLALNRGEDPPGLTPVAPATPPASREVYALLINGAKERAPAAAEALIRRTSPA